MYRSARVLANLYDLVDGALGKKLLRGSWRDVNADLGEAMFCFLLFFALLFQGRLGNTTSLALSTRPFWGESWLWEVWEIVAGTFGPCRSGGFGWALTDGKRLSDFIDREAQRCWLFFFSFTPVSSFSVEASERKRGV